MAMTNRVRGAFINKSGSFNPPSICHPSSISNGITSQGNTVTQMNRTVSSEIADDAEEKKEDAEDKRLEEEQSTEQEIERLVSENAKRIFAVENLEQARHAMATLRRALRENPQRIFACDTEVKNIDVLKESPRGHGTVTCFSVYCGNVHFGKESSEAPQTHLWVDTMGKDGDDAEYTEAIFAIFKDFFEDSSFLKVWHNYGFDRHVMTNMHIHCRGFGGDTMHMARLWDTSRKGKGYSLEALSTAKELKLESSESKKISMKKIFGKRKEKRDGTLGLTVIVPPVETIQLDEHLRPRWIYYSARDAKATYDLYHKLKSELEDRTKFRCVMDPSISVCYPQMKTLWDFYCLVWRPFGELLTEMEDVGFYVNTEHLKEAQARAEIDQEKAMGRFRSWARSRVEGAVYMNPSSDAQVRTLLFAGTRRRKVQKKSKQASGEGDKNNSEMDYVEFVRELKVDSPEYTKFIQEGKSGKKPKKLMTVELHGLWDKGKPCPLTPKVFTAAGWPAVSALALKALVGKPGAAQKLLEETYNVRIDNELSDLLSADASGIPDEDMSIVSDIEEENAIMNQTMAEHGLGPLYAAFDDHREGLEACVAVEALLEISAIKTLLASFILPLQDDRIKTPDGRIHGSMNLNTETGRLSCRRPNLQNQPALEKDRYKVRQSFTATEGNVLIVADYGQLELRILAHLTNCRSMLGAFKSGGDFHSRTAAGMYDHIKEAIREGKVALERGNGDSEDVKLVKDVFASERRRAKVLNFSIAYGKTPHGLAKDWEVSLQEAEDTLQRWYSDRQEVREWQENTIRNARQTGYVTTLLGRRRNLPEIRSSGGLRAHAERASINTPIQGSAADIVTAAMLAIDSNKPLKQLGFRLLSQIHDEVILEGPAAFKDEAMSLVVQCMERPFPTPDGGYCNPLRVDLAVDCKADVTWYDAK